MKRVLVDTYAFLAAATDTLTPKAKELMKKIAMGEIKGVIHFLIIYEILYHWLKGRLPSFTSEKELLDYLKIYFLNVKITLDIVNQASKIKLKGDALLSEAEDPLLKKRRLSACDALTIAIGKILNLPILTGDKDLSYVAKKIGVEIIW